MQDHSAIVLKNKSGKFLFIKRALTKKSLPGIWSFPSGTVEENEDIIYTAAREAKEELGIEIIAEKIFAVHELSEFFVRLNFVMCRIKNSEDLIIDKSEIEKFIWMSFEDFFEKFSDQEIGHGLIWLRKNSDIYKSL